MGINHNGSIKICKKLIKQVRESGSWGVKFQYRKLKNYLKNFKSSAELGKEIIDKEVKKNYLFPKKILKSFEKKLNLYFYDY